MYCEPKNMAKYRRAGHVMAKYRRAGHVMAKLAKIYTVPVSSEK